ncbi:MAG: ATPase, T2SS/T4P/T4SS family, partial [Gammaproteobacteria bacterium]|nr:ATPase, T2SS/T4P/T4SS family [Gammaproteobacteria bacterium]
MFDTTVKAGKGVDRKLTLVEVLDALLADGMISSDDAEELRATMQFREQSGTHPLIIIANKHLDNIKIGQGKLTLEALTLWFSNHVSLPYLRIDPLKIDVTAVTQVVPYAYAASHAILPVKVSLNLVTFAVCDPHNTEWMQEMEHVLQKKIDRVIVNPEDISRYLIEFYNLSRSVLNATDQNKDQGGLQNLEQLIDMGRSGKLDANDHHVVSIVDWLLQYAFEQRASDIHMEPRREQGNIRFRIDGVLHNVYELPPPVMAAVTSRLKILGRMDLAEKRRPQDGRVKTRTPDGVEIELRLSTMPTTFGEKLVMRIFDPDVLVKDFTALGFSNRDIVNWHKMIKQPHGIILVTGPTGSGKTTSLYSTLKQLAKPEINVCTVEDPIEMVEPSFNQM